MNLPNPNDMPSLLERHELKYLIPEYMVEPISEFASVYCRPDKHSRKAGDGFYKVVSLYLDTPGNLFLGRRMERVENRFNMRVRTYGKSGLPCFFEVKQKRVRIIRKFRATVIDPDWPRIFETSSHALKTGGNPRDEENANLFLQLACSYNVEPKVLTQYRRKAFVSDVDDYARVTFDTDLKYQPAEGFSLVPDDKKMDSYDNCTVFDPECSVILELKCYTEHVPIWMLDLINHFDLRRGRFSKYVASHVNVLNHFRHDEADRMAMAA